MQSADCMNVRRKYRFWLFCGMMCELLAFWKGKSGEKGGRKFYQNCNKFIIRRKTTTFMCEK